MSYGFPKEYVPSATELRIAASLNGVDHFSDDYERAGPFDGLMEAQTGSFMSTEVLGGVSQPISVVQDLSTGEWWAFLPKRR